MKEKMTTASHDDHVTTSFMEEDGATSGDVPVIISDLTEAIPVETKNSVESCDDYVIVPDMLSSTPIGSAHSNDLLDTLTPKVFPNIVPQMIKVEDGTTPPQLRRSPQIDSLSCDSCDTDDLMNDRLEEQQPLQMIFEKEEQKVDSYPWNKPVVQQEEDPLITIALISRRSRYRAGRY